MKENSYSRQLKDLPSLHDQPGPLPQEGHQGGGAEHGGSWHQDLHDTRETDQLGSSDTAITSG